MSMSLSRGFLARFVNQVFVETGTFDGRGVLLAREVGFRIVHTIELDPARVSRSREVLAGLPDVTLHEGDTVEILPRILSLLEDRATIFLDAHPVGEGDRCAIGRWRHPLLHELDLIRTHSLRKDHTIIVDDRHDFQIYGTSDAEVIGRLLEINPTYNARIEGDTVVATISA